ncbi:hypothetical protein PQ692_10110 [Thermoanaerobacterium thermosaccharolyticum]|uniref:hypothetical protein n=1 Tax=Thermoanaerobacterium thermosaccharolyticum TaxID=1517 RepID=UPI003D2C2F2D
MKVYINSNLEKLNTDLAKEFDICRNLIDCDVAVLSDILNKEYIKSLIAIGKKIILLTDKNNVDLVETAKNIGVSKILFAPFNSDELIQTVKNTIEVQNQDNNTAKVYVDTGLESLDMTLKKQFKNRLVSNFNDADILISYKENKNEIDKLTDLDKEVILIVPNEELLNYAKDHGIVHTYNNCSIEDIIKAEKALQGKIQNNLQSDFKSMQKTADISYVSYDEKHVDDENPDEDAEKYDAIDKELSKDEEKKVLSMINQFIYKKTKELKEVVLQLEKENSMLKDEKFQLEKNNSKLEDENQRLKHVLNTIKETLSGGEVK